MKRIFLAEDKPNIIESLKFLLLHAGFDVHLATDGWQALEQAFHQHLNVLFLGVMLPKLDGHEVLRQLRADPRGKDLPMLMLTARGQREDP